MSDENLLSFIHELGHLKKVKREGWRLSGVEFPESVADHSLRVAQIAFILAKKENFPNPFRVCTMSVFHDIVETRIQDIHKVANRYMKIDEEQAMHEQTHYLGEIGKEIFDLCKEAKEKTTIAARIAKDADILECAFTAKEYLELGYDSKEFLDCADRLKTKTAKQLLHKLQKSKAKKWWKDLRKF
ncbi:MAG: HD domain-containing protein [archaeon]|nr:HD domain-containing protein [archaeon]